MDEARRRPPPHSARFATHCDEWLVSVMMASHPSEGAAYQFAGFALGGRCVARQISTESSVLPASHRMQEARPVESPARRRLRAEAAATAAVPRRATRKVFAPISHRLASI